MGGRGVFGLIVKFKNFIFRGFFSGINERVRGLVIAIGFYFI